MSLVQTNPPSLDMAASETLPLEVDFANYLGASETVNGAGAPTCTLVDLTDGSSTAGMLSGGPTVSGNRVRQTVTGLQAGHKYLLEVVIRVAVGKTWAAQLEIVCAR